MMTANDREQAIRLAQAITPSEGSTANRLARGLLAEHGEVLAGRTKIGELTREAQASAERFVEQERRHVADIAAARGVTARLRASITTGGADEVRTMALAGALDAVENGFWDVPIVLPMAAALLALSEENKATAARLAAVLAGVERVIAEARGT